jgi:hypothetical protein
MPQLGNHQSPLFYCPSSFRCLSNLRSSSVYEEQLFRYLGLILQRDKDIDEDVSHIIKVEWMNQSRVDEVTSSI